MIPADHKGTLVLLSPNTHTHTTTLRLSVPNRYLMRGATRVHRRHHTDHHTQPGCQRHCVDENLERRNHYLDLAGIENYTSRFGAGEWTEAKALEGGAHKVCGPF